MKIRNYNEIWGTESNQLHLITTFTICLSPSLDCVQQAPATRSLQRRSLRQRSPIRAALPTAEHHVSLSHNPIAFSL